MATDSYFCDTLFFIYYFMTPYSSFVVVYTIATETVEHSGLLQFFMDMQNDKIFEDERDQNGYIFVDRDPDQFQIVLDTMRHGEYDSLCYI